MYFHVYNVYISTCKYNNFNSNRHIIFNQLHCFMSPCHHYTNLMYNMCIPDIYQPDELEDMLKDKVNYTFEW